MAYLKHMAIANESGDRGNKAVILKLADSFGVNTPLQHCIDDSHTHSISFSCLQKVIMLVS